VRKAARCSTRYDLSSDEREALAAWHVRKLYDMGANPLLLLLSAFASGKCRVENRERRWPCPRLDGGGKNRPSEGRAPKELDRASR
jgi:hypothetical protein